MESSSRSWVRGRRIGNGSFGAVNLAFDKSTGEAFAVKSVALHSSNRTPMLALENEIGILKSLSSPHIVEYLGDDTSREQDGGGACRNLHVEFMPGGTLANLAAEKKQQQNCPVNELEVRAYARCVARALRYLHTVAGVVHCDVKGRNVLLGRVPGAAKLADFGSAVRISGENKLNWARGTPLWMAPEVARGERPRPTSDVWSLGCTVIETVTGAQPWPELKHKEAEAAMFHIGYSGELPEFPFQISKLGMDFLEKCLRRDAGERWTAEQLLQHPFLAEASISMEESPRGVLDWANSDFDNWEEDNCSMDSELGVSDSIDPITCGRERVRELASTRGIVCWDGEGWEEVRSAEKGNLQEEEEEEDTNCCSGVGCSVSSPCASSCSRCFAGDVICRHGIGLDCDLLLDWCEFLLHLKMIINMILFYFSLCS
ncbi:hypothetical protein Cni_G17261 [Canna indica]|uniref:Protein kinase domain-containing protein n=1 Tax=Canna indica TaxID=4628 RepID=A0AAQ3KGQ6_9LILI|nr:hypothetical protein Cni_G17261 [Canna indica]